MVCFEPLIWTDNMGNLLIQHLGVSHFPFDKNLNWSELEAFAYDSDFCLKTVKKTQYGVEKEKMLTSIPPFPTMFIKLLFIGVVKTGAVW